ncbi:hypothetical protein KKF34_18635 [Myxococcota bacterium]|nr:hypothetical protein [Myxococcota bacterium]MBU1380769.1 hypothetical protein [Myxococcota bacterium]MBU1498903.1 hypothetical protein [Myxococcota bacterium]
MARKRRKKRTTRSEEISTENITEVSALEVSFTSGEISGEMNSIPDKKFSEEENTELSGSAIGITSGEINIDPKSPLMVSFNTTAKIEISGDDVIDESKPLTQPPVAKPKIGSEDATPVPGHLRSEPRASSPAVIGDAILKEIENAKKQEAPKKRHTKKPENSGVSGIIVDDAPPEQRMKSGEIVISTDKCFDPDAESEKKEPIKTTTPMAIIADETDIPPDNNIQNQLRSDEEKRRKLKDSLKQLINSHPSPFVLTDHPLPDKTDENTQSAKWSNDEPKAQAVPDKVDEPKVKAVPDKIEIEVTTGSIIVEPDIEVLPAPVPEKSEPAPSVAENTQSEETEKDMSGSKRAEKRSRRNRKNRQHQAVSDIKPASEVIKSATEPAVKPASEPEKSTAVVSAKPASEPEKSTAVAAATQKEPAAGTVEAKIPEEQSTLSSSERETGSDNSSVAATPLEQRLVSSNFNTVSPIKNTHDLPAKDFSKIEEDFFDADLAGDTDYSGLEEIISQIETENPKKAGFFDSLKKIFISNGKTDPPKPRTPAPSGTSGQSGRRRRR